MRLVRRTRTHTRERKGGTPVNESGQRRDVSPSFSMDFVYDEQLFVQAVEPFAGRTQRGGIHHVVRVVPFR
jgi:hypothetical protein